MPCVGGVWMEMEEGTRKGQGDAKGGLPLDKRVVDLEDFEVGSQKVIIA